MWWTSLIWVRFLSFISDPARAVSTNESRLYMCNFTWNDWWKRTLSRCDLADNNTNEKRKTIPQIISIRGSSSTLQWRHNEHDGVSNHQPHDCLLNGLFRRRSKKTSKLRVTDLCEGNSPVTSEFPAQRASNAKNVSIWWRHHDQRN